MKHLRQRTGKAIAFLSFATLAACASTLIWESTYNQADSVFIHTSKLTNDDTLLLSVAKRTDNGDGTFISGASIVQYDSDGSLIGEQTLGDNAIAAELYPMGSDTIFVTASNFTENRLSVKGTPTELWLLSKNDDHSPLKVLDLEEGFILQAIVSDNLLFVGTTQGDILTIDQQGNIVNTAQSPVPQMDSLDKSPDDKLYATNHHSLYIYDDGLNLTGIHRLDELGLGTCWTLKTLVTFDNDNNLIIQCFTGITKIDANSMQPVFTHTINDLFTETERNDHRESFEFPVLNYESTPIIIDESNDIYWISAKHRVYLQDVGGLTIYGSGTSLKAEIPIIKIDGSTGERLWTNEISGDFFPTPEGVLTSFYYPISKSIVDDED